MIVRRRNFQVISKNSNSEYYSGDIYPDWTPIAGIHDIAPGPKGGGVEPHYHDNDEFWFWTTGRGEVWLDDVNISVGPNSVAYTPMGVVHKFLMHTDFEVVAVITKSERKKRHAHILIEEDGPPEPTVPGFVVPGEQNSGPFPNRGARCPLSELRLVHLKTGEEVASLRAGANEHWCVLNGIVDLEVDGQKLQLHAGDVALIRAGTTRHLGAVTAARLVFLRE